MSVSEHILMVLTVKAAVIAQADHGTPHFFATLRIYHEEAVSIHICLDSLHTFAHRSKFVIRDGFDLLVEPSHSKVFALDLLQFG